MQLKLFSLRKIWRKFGDRGNRCCDDCGAPKPAGPMLYDSLWRTISRSENPWLCFDCTESAPVAR